MTPDQTPIGTEALHGYDFDGVPAGDQPAKPPHSWQVLSQTASTVHLRCSKCRAETNNAFLADLHGCPGDDTTRLVLPGPLAEPKPRVLSRRAEDVSYMAPETIRKRFADKLRDIGYQEPVLPKSEAPAAPVITPTPRIPWRTVWLWIGVACVVVAAVTWGVCK